MRGHNAVCEADDRLLQRFVRIELLPTKAAERKRLAHAGFAVATIDHITQPKQAEQVLQKQLQQYQALVDNSQGLMCMHDLDGRFLFVNAASAALLGYQPAEMIGKNARQFLAPDVQYLYDDYLARIRRQRTDSGFIRVMTKTGQERIWQYSNVRYEEAGKPSYVLGHAQDVTDRIGAEAARRESEKRFRTLIKGSIQGIVIHRNWVPLFANQRYAEILGYASPNEILQLDSLLPILAPQERQCVAGYVQAHQLGQAVAAQQEHQALRKDGTPIWLDVQIQEVWWDDEPALQVVISDITARKRLDAALQESERRFRDLIEGSIQGVVIHRQGKPLFVNQAYVEIFGYETPDDILQMEHLILEIGVPHERTRLLGYLQSRMRGEPAPMHYESQGIRRDGSTIWLDNVVSVVSWEGVPAVQTTTIDITPRKQAEAALQRAYDDLERRVEERSAALRVANRQLQQEMTTRQLIEEEQRKLAALVHHSNDFIAMATLEGQVVFVNDAGRKMVGLDRLHSASPKVITDFHFSDYDALLRDHILPTVQAHGHWIGETQLRHFKTGEPIDVLADCFFITDLHRGNAVGLATIQRDITARKRTEARMRHLHTQLRSLAARRLEIQEEERKRIARELHDELGQALTALHMDLAWFSQHRPLEPMTIPHKVAGMLDLTNRMFRSVEGLVTSLRPRILDDLGLAAAAEWLLQDFQIRTGIVVTQRLDVDASRLDAQQSLAIFRILQEALTNAVRHANATRIDVDLCTEHASLHLIVRDNGCGITEEALTNPHALGLLGMRERIAPLEGEVHVVGDPDQGTVITVRLALADQGSTTIGEQA